MFLLREYLLWATKWSIARTEGWIHFPVSTYKNALRLPLIPSLNKRSQGAFPDSHIRYLKRVNEISNKVWCAIVNNKLGYTKLPRVVHRILHLHCPVLERGVVCGQCGWLTVNSALKRICQTHTTILILIMQMRTDPHTTTYYVIYMSARWCLTSSGGWQPMVHQVAGTT